MRTNVTYTLDTKIVEQFHNVVERQSRSATIELLVVEFLKRKGVSPSSKETTNSTSGNKREKGLR